MARSLFIPLLFALLFCSCVATRPPIPIGTIPEYRSVSTTDEQYGHTVLNQLTQQYPIDYADSRLNKVTEIIDKIAAAAGAGKDPWHVFILSGKNVKNAAATRGNHIFIWTGMIDLTKSDDELAAVLSHEIAHLVAGHTDPDPDEQVKKILVGAGAMAAGLAVAAATNSYALSNTFGRLTTSVTEGFGEEALINPYSRERELEADHIGLMLMARAGFNPKNSILFWERMMNDPTLRSDTAFFSSHPTTRDRIDNLKKALPTAMQYYQHPPNKNREMQFITQGRSNTLELTRNNSFSSPSKANGEIWVVTSPKAILYRAPSAKSPAIGEIVQGGKAVVVDKIGSWLAVTDPDVGYLKSENAQKSAQ